VRGTHYWIDYGTGEVSFFEAIPLQTEIPEGSGLWYDNYIVTSTSVDCLLVIDETCELLVGDLTILGGGSILIEEDALATFYVTGEVKIGGNGIVNESAIPGQLRIYGTNTCTEIDIAGTPDFYGVVYAPEAEIVCSGNSDVYGSLVGNYIRLGGTTHIFWDQCLQDDSSIPSLVVVRDWQELPS